MVAISTIAINKDGARVLINKVDYDPKTHKLWKALKKKEVTEESEKLIMETATKEPAKLNKKVSKKDT